jgi:beta-glucanase (GH16 family)
MKQLLGILSTIFIISFITFGCKKNDAATTPSTTDVNDSLDLPGWKLVWNDEFNGNKIDLTKWNYEVNGDGGGNNELQYYTDSSWNSFIEDSCLVIQALKQNYKGKEYMSARLNTNLKGDWLYGRFDIRAKLPYGQGLWPAIWMLPTDWVYGGWPQSGEIDIMEELGDNTQKVYGTIHYASSAGNHVQQGGNYTLTSGTFAGEFHLFTVVWDSTGMKFYVDNKYYYTATQGKPFDQRFHIILNVAVGGNWPGNPDASAIFPQRMVVDYVRVYKKVE